MLKQIFTVTFFFLILGSVKAHAGWYECYNFKGVIDKYPITLSIQINPGYFGEKEKKNFNILGVYKYDKHNDPIKLEGIIDFKTNKALLYEVINNKHSASFEFDFSKTESNGTWKNLSTAKTLPLHLSYVSQLIDTSDEIQLENIEILQANSLTELYFVGDYSKNAGKDRAQMNKLKIIQKKDNVVIQTIDFTKIETQTGNVLTIIYENVEISDSKTKELTVSNNIGRMGGYLVIRFDPKTKQFKLNSVPKIDGPN